MALTTRDIERKMETFRAFQGVYSIDRLPYALFEKPFGIIVNLDPSFKPGSHWVAIFSPEHGTSIYFDSYGNPPPALIESYIERNSKYYGWDFNPNRLQGDLSIKCGWFAMLFLISNFRSIEYPMRNCEFEQNENSIKRFFK